MGTSTQTEYKVNPSRIDCEHYPSTREFGGRQFQGSGQSPEHAETPPQEGLISKPESCVVSALKKLAKAMGRDYASFVPPPEDSSVSETPKAPETPSRPATDRSAMWADVQRRRTSQVLPTERLSSSYCRATGTPEVSGGNPSETGGPTWQEAERARASREADEECEKVFHRVSQNANPSVDPPFLKKISLATHLNKKVEGPCLGSPHQKSCQDLPLHGFRSSSPNQHDHRPTQSDGNSFQGQELCHQEGYNDSEVSSVSVPSDVSSEDDSRLPRYLRRLKHHLNKTVGNIKSRMRKRNPDNVKRIHQIGLYKTMPDDIAVHFHPYEVAFINRVLYLAARYGGGRFVGYINYVAEKMGMCAKTAYRAIKKAVEHRVIHYKMGEYNRFLGRREPGIITIIHRDILDCIKKFFRPSGLSIADSKKKERFFVRPMPFSQPWVMNTGLSTGPPD